MKFIGYKDKAKLSIYSHLNSSIIKIICSILRYPIIQVINIVHNVINLNTITKDMINSIDYS